VTALSACDFRRLCWCQDTSDPGHFGPKTFRHHEIGAEVSGQIGTSAELSRGHFGTGTELSRPPAAALLRPVPFFAAPTVWNLLPDHLCDPAVDSEQFGQDLRTYVRRTFEVLVLSRCYIISLYKSIFTYLLTYSLFVSVNGVSS